MIEYKKCCKCNISKPITDFLRYYCKSRKQYRIKSKCRKCCAKYMVLYRKRLLEKDLDSVRKRQREENLNKCYGITSEDYEKMFIKQDGKCKICGSPPNGKRRLHVDHCHETGKIRHLLCHYCNTGLGAFKHKADLLNKAIEYLKIK